MEDRLTRGFVAGLFGGMVMNGEIYMSDNRHWGELVFFSGITGAIAAPIKLLVHHVFEWTKLAAPFYSDLNAYLIHGHHHAEGFIESIFGEMGDMAIGAIFGVILGIWLSRSHPRYHWWIGLGYGIGIWFASLAFGNLTKIIKPEQTTDWSLFAHFLAMLTFGLLFVLAARIWKPLRERIN